MKNRSTGEEAFAQSFQFQNFVNESDQDELRDFFYKFAHNFKEAQEMLELLNQVNAIYYGNNAPLLFRIHAMALQCFPLAMRRLTDNISKRSLQKLIAKLIREEFKDAELAKIREIHSHYEFYLNKGVAHQDEHSIQEVLEAFPDSKTIDADIAYLRGFYNKITSEICSSYISIDVSPPDFKDEIEKLS